MIPPTRREVLHLIIGFVRQHYLEANKLVSGFSLAGIDPFPLKTKAATRGDAFRDRHGHGARDRWHLDLRTSDRLVKGDWHLDLDLDLDVVAVAHKDRMGTDTDGYKSITWRSLPKSLMGFAQQSR